MTSTANGDFPRIGPRLKHLRKLRGLNLRDVGRDVGCSEGYLSKIENNKAAPSLAVLHRLAAVLDTNLAYLFDTGEAGAEVVGRAGQRPIVELDPLRQGRGIRIERVIPYAERHLLQCNIHIIEPGGTSDGQIEHEGEEVGYILEGQLELVVEDKVYALNLGDSFHFASHRPHGYRNVGATRCRVLWVNTPPTF